MRPVSEAVAGSDAGADLERLCDVGVVSDDEVGAGRAELLSETDLTVVPFAVVATPVDERDPHVDLRLQLLEIGARSREVERPRAEGRRAIVPSNTV